ncbi:hypothetical protein HU200_000550 [Digitaria exilis]|uniref:Uncharacterized protein n=1 Tax=Digitaria exilis TaxID=1010633 RepID=A0A835KWQ1_9POAL|nr:hypothetical protein HU200_000550 [Digitaria exilis]
MEALRAEAVIAGTPPLPSAHIVSRVLWQGSSNDTFLENASIADYSLRSRSCGENPRPTGWLLQLHVTHSRRRYSKCVPCK